MPEWTPILGVEGRLPGEERWEVNPGKGQAQRRETVWLARRPTGEPSAIVRDVTGDESDEVVGEGSRRP